MDYDKVLKKAEELFLQIPRDKRCDRFDELSEAMQGLHFMRAASELRNLDNGPLLWRGHRFMWSWNSESFDCDELGLTVRRVDPESWAAEVVDGRLRRRGAGPTEALEELLLYIVNDYGLYSNVLVKLCLGP